MAGPARPPDGSLRDHDTVQLGGLVGDRMGITDESSRGRRAARARLPPPWHTDRAPIIDLVDLATDLARWAAKVGGDIAQLVQLGEITPRRWLSAAAGKRNPIDAMRAMAAAEAVSGSPRSSPTPNPTSSNAASVAGTPSGSPSRRVPDGGRGDGGVGAALASLEVEPSALVVADDRRSPPTPTSPRS